MSGLRIGSLCTGTGALDLAASAVIDAELTWVCDPDPGATALLAHHYPGLLNFGDLTAVDWAEVESVDILTAGFPCQDVSSAGRRAGLRHGTRTGLWLHIVDIIDQLRPSLVVLENVRGLLSAEADSAMERCPWCLGDGPGTGLRALGAVLGDLADLGFDAEWQMRPASADGAAHRRERVFLTATPANSSRFGHEWTWPAWSRRSGDPDRRDHAVPDTTSHGRHARWPESARVVRGSDAAVRSDAAPDPDRDGRESRPERNGLKVEPGQQTSCGDDIERRVLDWAGYEPAIRRWESVLGRPAPAPTVLGKRGGRQLNPSFVEWMQGLPEGWVTDVPELSRSQQLKLLGNGVVPLQCESALRLLLPRLVSTEGIAA